MSATPKRWSATPGKLSWTAQPVQRKLLAHRSPAPALTVVDLAKDLHGLGILAQSSRLILNPYRPDPAQCEQSEPVGHGLRWGEIMIALAIKFVASGLILLAGICLLFIPIALIGPQAARVIDAVLDSGYLEIATFVGWFITFEAGILYLSRRVSHRQVAHAVAYSTSVYLAAFLNRLAQWRFELSWQSLAYYALLIPASVLGMMIATRFRRGQPMPLSDLG